MAETCSYGTCELPRGKALGLCNAHYSRQRLGQSMTAPIRNVRATDEERFWSKVDKSGSCWIWQASDVRGYGIFRLNGHNRVAHRVAYMWANGPIPDPRSR
jgi:hypothetical protein